MALSPTLHDAIGARLAVSEQRYTRLRRVLVDTLAASAGPLTMPQILESAPQLPQSSAYRNVTALIEAGVVRRIAGPDDYALFELAEEFSGHHHHLVCASCGRVDDVAPSERLERALGETVRALGEAQGYQVFEHRVELLGFCPGCAAG